MLKNLILQYPVRVLLILLTSIYATGLNGRFVNDDITYFVYNDLIPNLGITDFASIFTQPSNYWGELLPLRDYLYVVQFSLFGTEPFGYHLVSLCLYLLIVALIIPLFNAVSKTGAVQPEKRWSLVFGTAFFALHPVHVESVAYISGQKDLLCALFSIICLLLFFHLTADGKHQNAKIWIGFIGSYYCAFLAKNLAVATAMLITVCGVLLLRRCTTFWSRIVPLWILINIPVALWIKYSISVSDVTKIMAVHVDISLMDRIIRAIRIIGRHLILAFYPEPLSFGYPFEQASALDGPFFAGLAGSILLGAIIVFSRDFTLRFASALVLLYLLPVSQLFFDLFNASIFDRYLFISILGIGMLAGRLLELIAHFLQPRLVHFGALVLLTALALQTTLYIPVYRSDLSVAKRSYALYPEDSSAFFNYVTALIEENRLDDSESLLTRTNLINQPPWVRGYLRGWIAFERGDVQTAQPLLFQSYRQCAMGGYYPYPGVLLARSMITSGNVKSAGIILDQVLHAPIHNPVEYFKAKKLLESLTNL